MRRILHIVGSLEKAGIETFLINLYRNIDITELQFDFAIYNTPSENSYYKEVISKGGRVFLIPPKNKGIIRNYKAIKKIVEDNKYDIVWRDCSSCVGGIDLLPAKVGGATTRILHAHSSNVFGIEKYLHYALRPLCCFLATKKLACGEKAAKWMFGNRTNTIVRNGIDVDKFKFNQSIRDEYRKKYNLNDCEVIGHVGRFDKVKNQTFLIDIFNEYAKKHLCARLVLIGEGKYRDECEKKVKAYGVEDKVLFLGIRSDIAELLQMFDVFVMPSIYEGFPVTLVEAQASGLSAVVSDSISPETNIIGSVSYVGLSDELGKWIEAIEKKIIGRDKEASSKIRKAGFDIKQLANNIGKLID